MNTRRQFISTLLAAPAALVLAHRAKADTNVTITKSWAHHGRLYDRITVEHEPDHSRTIYHCFHRGLNPSFYLETDQFVTYRGMGNDAYRGPAIITPPASAMPLWLITDFEIDLVARTVSWRELA